MTWSEVSRGRVVLAAATVLLLASLGACRSDGPSEGSLAQTTRSPSVAASSGPQNTSPSSSLTASPRAPSIDLGGSTAPDTPGGERPELQVVRHDESYVLNGKTPEAMQAQIKKRGPGRWAAHVSYFITFDWVTVERPDGTCKLTSPRVRLTYTVLLPEVDQGVPSDALSYANRSIEQLRVHENGHVRIARDTAKHALKVLAGLRGRAFATCDALGHDAEARAKRAVHLGQQRQKDYDRVTHHGLQQAAA